MLERLACPFLIVLATLVSPAAEITSQPLVPASPGTTLFDGLSPERSGVDFVNPIDKDHPTKRLYLGAFACGGVAIGDLNGDGKHDLFLTSGPRPNRLYLNQGGLKFKDATAAAGIAGGVEWSGGAPR